MKIYQRRNVDRIELIERTLVALQAGQPLPREIARAWERGLKAYIETPGSRLEDLMGFGNAPGKRGLWTELAMRQRDQILERFYQEYFCPQSPRAAAAIISNELAQRADNLSRRANPDIRDRAFDHLFDRLAALGLPLPGALHLYRLMQDGVALFDAAHNNVATAAVAHGHNHVHCFEAGFVVWNYGAGISTDNDARVRPFINVLA